MCILGGRGAAYLALFKVLNHRDESVMEKRAKSRVVASTGGSPLSVSIEQDTRRSDY